MFTYKTTVNWKTARFDIEILDGNGVCRMKFENLSIDAANRAIEGLRSEGGSEQARLCKMVPDEEPTDEERAVAMLETLAEGGM